ncbi:MAG: phage portal protein, partial [Pseudomonadota bacterium]
ELLTEFYGYLQTAGNAYLEAVELDGEVRELYALRPDRVKVRVGEGGWPDSYEYSAGGRSVVFRRDAMTGASPILHLRLFHPLNDHYGMSPLEAAASAIDIHNAGAAWNKALLDNAARPSGALVYRGGEAGGNLTDEQFDRIKTELADAHQGADAAGRPLLLEGGLDWKPMSLSPADMDFLNAKNASAREIALAFGVPPMLLGIPGDNTYANYREANLAFHRQTVLPLVAKAAEAMTNWLGARFDAATIAPDIANAEATSAEREAMWARLERVSFLTINEKRAAAGYPPVDDGDALERR